MREPETVKPAALVLLVALLAGGGCQSMRYYEVQAPEPPPLAHAVQSPEVEIVALAASDSRCLADSGKLAAFVDVWLEEDFGAAIDAALRAPSRGIVEDVQRAVAAVWVDAPRQLAERIAGHARDYGIEATVGAPEEVPEAPTATADAPARIDISAAFDCSSAGDPVNPEIAWVLSAGLDGPDPELSSESALRLTASSRALHIRQWARNGAESVDAEFGRALAALAQVLAEELFLVEPLTTEAPPLPEQLDWRQPLEPALALGLAPLAPPTGAPIAPGSVNVPAKSVNGSPLSPSRGFIAPVVAGNRPRFRWQPLPVERLARPGAPIEDVTYDFRLARAYHGTFPEAVIYERTGLTVPEHVIEVPLQQAVYYWTVRARYRVDGRPRATEWTALHARGRTELAQPNEYSPYFKLVSGRAATAQ